MRAEALLEVTEDILLDFQATRILELFQRLIDAVPLTNSISETNEKTIATRRQILVDAVNKSRFNRYPASKAKILAHAGALEFLGDNLLVKVSEAFSFAFPMIIVEKLKEVKQTLIDIEAESRKYVSGAIYFDVAVDRLAPGTFELVVGIPGEAIHNELESFGKEALKINRIFGVFTEIATGSREPTKLRAIASSDPTFFLIEAPAVAALIAAAIERAAALYEKILSIIKVQRDLKSHDIPEKIVVDLKQHIDETIKRNLASVAEGIENAHFHRIEASRHQELRTELRTALLEITRRLDNGYLFDVRGEPIAESVEDDAEPSQSAKAIAEAIKRVEELRPRLHQFEAERDPAIRLLSAGEEPPASSS